MSNALVPLTEALTGLLDPKSAKELTDVQLVGAYPVAQAVEAAGKKAKDVIKNEHARRAESEGFSVDTWRVTEEGKFRLRANKPRREVKDVVKASDVLEPIVSEEEFNACLTLSLPKLQKMIGDARYAEALAALDEAGLVFTVNGSVVAEWKAV